MILQSKKTRSITEAVLIYLVVSVSILWAGVEIGRFSGIYVGLLSMVIAEGGRTLWLWLRSREARNALCERDRLSATSQSNP